MIGTGWLESLTDAELLTVTAELHRLASQTHALAVHATTQVAAGQVAAGGGFTATSRWLEVTAGLSKGESRASVALGEKLAFEFAATGDAWLAGEISAGAAREITTLIPAKLRGLVGTHYDVARARIEAAALHVAATGTVTAVRRVIERAALLADPAGADAAALAAREAEFLRFTPVPDGVAVTGFLSTETAAVVLTAFDQCHDTLYRRGQLTTDHPGGLDGLDGLGDHLGATPGLRRQRREHRNARILADLVTRLLDDGALGTKHAQRPHLTVTVHADEYAAGLGGHVLLPGFGTVPVPNSTIDRLLCDAEVHPVLTRRPGAPPDAADRAAADPVQHPAARAAAPRSIPAASPPRPTRRGSRRYVPDPTGGGWEYDLHLAQEPSPEALAADTDLAATTEHSDDLDDEVSWWNRLFGEPTRHVLDVGRSYRTAPPKLRRALTVRDGGCAVPGCDLDASRCEAHHITYWEHHGETAIANMVLLCAKHHHMVHTGTWRIEVRPDLDPGHPDYVTLTLPPHSTPLTGHDSHINRDAARDHPHDQPGRGGWRPSLERRPRGGRIGVL